MESPIKESWSISLLGAFKGRESEKKRYTAYIARKATQDVQKAALMRLLLFSRKTLRKKLKTQTRHKIRVITSTAGIMGLCAFAVPPASLLLRNSAKISFATKSKDAAASPEGI